jgi:hypothetical protein
MAREIRGYIKEGGADLYEVMDAYCEGMAAKDIYLIEDTYHEMLRAGEFEDITGVQ